ncbi:hypothetical protein NLI96_g4302 [Meripilus lineatus]|uniref:DUF6533 domain-containing protein n=1 Tax=Meripilus lineatus TaxID=2056292 RepID=A0AAD5YI59_9APHY|nr:hypothetical protein NLI96_g4302 [Physisporinus lineatus]
MISPVGGMEANNVQSALQPLFAAFDQTRLATQISGAALTIVAYDVCDKLFDEVEYIWRCAVPSLPRLNSLLGPRSRWSIAKVLYIFARYYGLAYLIYMVYGDVFNIERMATRLVLTSGNFVSLSIDCFLVHALNAGLEAARRLHGGGPNVFTTLVNLIFIMRLYALYHRNTRVLIFLLTLLFGEYASSPRFFILVTDMTPAEFTAEMYSTIFTVLNEVPMSAPLGLPWLGCIVSLKSNTRQKGLAAWILCLIVAFNPTHHRIFTTVFFALMMIIFVQTPIAAIAPPWIVALYSISGSRLVLNLRISAREAHSNMQSVALPSQFSSSSQGTGQQDLAFIRSTRNRGRRVFEEFDYAVTSVDTIELGDIHELSS